MLAQEIAAIVKFLHGANPVSLYYDEVPQDFFVPSMYFPVPQLTSNQETVRSFRNNYAMFIKVFEKDTSSAQKKALVLSDSLNVKRLRVPLYDLQGVPTGDFLRLNSVTSNKVDDGVAQIGISWHSNYPFEVVTSEKIEEFILDTFIK